MRRLIHGAEGIVFVKGAKEGTQSSTDVNYHGMCRVSLISDLITSQAFLYSCNISARFGREHGLAYFISYKCGYGLIEIRADGRTDGYVGEAPYFIHGVRTRYNGDVTESYRCCFLSVPQSATETTADSNHKEH